ncbi:nucleotidyl transferase AbiEii/AbiGii toxin family protein [Mucilaginibacter sp. SMC90]|uniref:nucleotidyl transferase AbiEii/AbiGii toxin family protein n=1 Tax=Mucilaginibacter sp. SMC90 TaxID=2929803 RepID=UPI001FB2175A|nr:nucleotidyl transferase AbiEii/AbiGii toxin family protein [Mucilaginibacter sp. SMC90]UOE48991.1 nucleotidyl transferase AbiEii/AbiGii toxin family protein [Mucilaginibacter sp. SMC90]
MKAVSDSLIETILKLQQLPSLSKSSLGGGTNLAIRYGHRISYDIDLFFPDIIRKQGYELIKEEVITFYGDAVFAIDYPCDENDQFLFQRFFVRRGESAIKVEILQNMQTHLEPEFIDGIKLMNIYDIAPLKLMSASNRANHKDIYDLDYLTDHIALAELMDLLKIRQQTYNQPEHQNIFDQDGEFSPIDNPDLLLKFEEPIKGSSSRPGHSNPRVDFIEGGKNWAIARSSWRRKVREYFRSIGKDFPSPQPR